MAKPLPCVGGRQRPHDEAWLDKGFFAVRRSEHARQSLCRAALPLPSAAALCRANGFAVRCHALPCRIIASRLPAPRTATRNPLPCAFQPPRTAKSAPLPCATRPPARQSTSQAYLGQPLALPLPCVCARQSDQMVLCRAHTHGKGPGVFHFNSVSGFKHNLNTNIKHK